MSVRSFTVGQQNSREDVYETLSVPGEKRRGNGETDYNLFIFLSAVIQLVVSNWYGVSVLFPTR
jgi:hypothetical protein